MILRGRVVIPIVLAALMQAGFAPSAHALFGRHHTSQQRAPRRAKKNTSPYAYLAPRKPPKQKKAKSTYHQSTVTGDLFSPKKKK